MYLFIVPLVEENYYLISIQCINISQNHTPKLNQTKHFHPVFSQRLFPKLEN